jgi:hypothetical protein
MIRDKIIFYFDYLRMYVIERGDNLALIELIFNKFFYFIHIIINWFLINYIDNVNLCVLMNQLVYSNYFNFYTHFDLKVFLIFKLLYIVNVLFFYTFLSSAILIFTSKLLLIFVMSLLFLSLIFAILAYINFFFLLTYYNNFFQVLLFLLAKAKIFFNLIFQFSYFILLYLIFSFQNFFLMQIFIYKILFIFITNYLLKFPLINLIVAVLKISGYKLVVQLIFIKYVNLFVIVFSFLYCHLFNISIICIKFSLYILYVLFVPAVKSYLNFEFLQTPGIWTTYSSMLSFLKFPSIDIYNGWEKIFSYEFRYFWTTKIYNNCVYFYDQYFIAFFIYLKLKIIKIINYLVDSPIKIRNFLVYLHDNHKFSTFKNKNNYLFIKVYWSEKRIYPILRFISLIGYSFFQFPVLIFNGLFDLIVNYFVLITKVYYTIYVHLKNNVFTFYLITEYIFEPIYFFIVYVAGISYYFVTDLFEIFILYFNSHNYHAFRPNFVRFYNPHLITLFLNRPSQMFDGLVYTLLIYLKHILFIIYQHLTSFYFEFIKSIIEYSKFLFFWLWEALAEIHLKIINLYSDLIFNKFKFFCAYFLKNLYYSLCYFPLLILYFFLTNFSIFIKFLTYFFELLSTLPNNLQLVFYDFFNQFLKFFYSSFNNNFNMFKFFCSMLDYLLNFWANGHLNLANFVLEFQILNIFFLNQNMFIINFLENIIINKANNLKFFILFDQFNTLKFEMFFGIFLVLYLIFIVKMVRTAWISYNYFKISMLLIEFDEKIVDIEDKNFNEMYFKIYHEELAKDIGIKVLSTFTQPKIIVDQFYEEWFSGGHNQFRQLKWRLLQRKNSIIGKKMKNLFFKNLEYYDFFDKEKYFYNGVDFLKHVRYTFFRIIYSYYRLYGFYNFKMFNNYAAMLHCDGFNKKKVGHMSFLINYSYYYYIPPIFVLNFLPKYSFAYKFANAQINLVRRSHKIKDWPILSFFNWLQISNLFWVVFYGLIFSPALLFYFLYNFLELINIYIYNRLKHDIFKKLYKK